MPCQGQLSRDLLTCQNIWSSATVHADNAIMAIHWIYVILWDNFVTTEVIFSYLWHLHQDYCTRPTCHSWSWGTSLTFVHARNHYAPIVGDFSLVGEVEEARCVKYHLNGVVQDKQNQRQSRQTRHNSTRHVMNYNTALMTYTDCQCTWAAELWLK